MSDWLHHPERVWVRSVLFQIHFWVGTVANLYVMVMSLCGSAIVYRNELVSVPGVEWLVRLHDELLLGSIGRVLNGIGGSCLLLLCLTGAVIWWPGVRNWRRSLKVKWSASFARFNWDLHSALGFWLWPLLVIWAVTGIYFGLPGLFDVIDPSDRYTDAVFFQLSELHFGRFDWVTKVIWSLVGLVPAVLAFTGMFVCCRRIIFEKPSNPNLQAD